MKGDLSNVPAPLTMVQWEGLLALPPTVRRQRVSLVGRKNAKTRKFIMAFTPVEFAIKQLGDIVFRQNRTARVFTTFHSDAVPFISEWLMSHRVPVLLVESFSLHELQNRVSLGLGIDRVIHATGLAAFQGRGISISDPNIEEFRN